MSYYHQNPAYHGSGEKYAPGNGGQVAVPMDVVDAPRWSWCSAGWSIFTFLFCVCPWCSLCGILCSTWSYADHKAGDYDRASHKRKWAWGCTMTALILSLLIVIAIIVVAVMYTSLFLSVIASIGQQ